MLNILEEQPQPVTLLNTLCDKDGKQVNIEHLIKGNKHIASVYVDGQFITSASSDYKRSAKRHAAKAALKELGYGPYQKTDVELDLMKDSERSKLLTKESEGSKLLTTESEGAKLLTKVSEGSKLLTEESEGSKLLTNEIEGAKLLKKESEGATLLTKESEGLKLLAKESEGSKLLTEESEGAKLLTNEREGVKLLTRNRELDEGIEIPVRAVEELLKYEFKNRKLLEEAFTHSSYTPCCSSTSYHRLTFLGYAALGLAISSYFFSTYPDIDCGKLTHLRDVNVSTEKLARVAVRHRLYHYLWHRDRHIDEKVKEFGITLQQEDDMEIYGGVMKAPKVLADIVASLTGAVYVDCGLDLNALWVIFRGLLEPIIMQNMLEEQPQPVRLLRGLCNKDGKQVNIQNLMMGNKHIARIDGQIIASASSEYKGSSKHHAAKAALEELGYGTYEKTDVELDLMKDSEGSKFLTKESEGSKLLTKESEGAKLLKEESEGSKLLMKESEGAKLLTKEREGSQLLTKESESAKYDLNELCSRKKWSKPCYRIEKEVGLVHGRSFICSVQVAIAEGVLFVTGEEKSQVEDAERSAALAMIHGLKQEHIMNIPYSGYNTPKGSEIFLCLSNKGQHEKQDEGIIEADQARTICSLETIADHNGQMEFEDQRSRKRKKTSSSLDCVASTHTVKKEKGS